MKTIYSELLRRKFDRIGKENDRNRAILALPHGLTATLSDNIPRLATPSKMAQKATPFYGYSLGCKDSPDARSGLWECRNCGRATVTVVPLSSHVTAAQAARAVLMAKMRRLCATCEV